jgi:autotransporter translocation and assembly factor TamB
MEGVTYGEVWGGVEATIKKDAASKESRIAISVPELHVDLPETGQANLQALEPDPNVRIGAVRKNGVFAVIATQPLESKPEPSGDPEVTVIDVKLGKISIRHGEEVKIGLTGELKVRLAEEMKLTGQIRTTGGKLDVAGKLFDLERAEITFDGANPPNPSILARARWESPVGYRVFAEYTGTAARAKLTLRSEPTLSQDQVLNLLMTGTPDAALGDGSNAAAMSVAGGIATKGINRALSDLSDLDVQARVDSTGGRSSGPYADTRVRPELAFQVNSSISARVTRVIGEPLAGTTPDKTFLTFDYRLGARWLVSTMVGDRGATALDLLWRFRY